MHSSNCFNFSEAVGSYAENRKIINIRKVYQVTYVTLHCCHNSQLGAFILDTDTFQELKKTLFQVSLSNWMLFFIESCGDSHYKFGGTLEGI